MERLVYSIDPVFWAGKRVFLTGHTGFKGSWLSIWLEQLGANVMGFALPPNTTPNLFDEAKVNDCLKSKIGDIRNLKKISKIMKDFDPEILIHMAAQPLVRYSYLQPVETYETNVMGTINVLESARYCKSLKVIIAVTTDKCYENVEKINGYVESDPMGGHDPYSSSKGCCELLISSYRRSFFNKDNSPRLASVRAGNVIGGGDWSGDRLIPDILKAFENSKEVIVRNPLSIRPWQHVLEPLSGYLQLAQKMYFEDNSFSQAWNFGPNDKDCKSVEWILNKITRCWGEDSSWKLDSENNPHEAVFLKLDCNKANKELKWFPRWGLEKTLDLIVDWHKKWMLNKNIKLECISQINEFNKKII